MLRLAANLTMLFTEVDFLDRFALAAAAGFRGVETLFPYEWPRAEIKARLDDSGLDLVLINMPPGDMEAGELGLAGVPGAETRFRRDFETAVEYATGLGVPQVHVMAGLPPQGVDPRAAEALFCENLAWAAAAARQHGLRLLIEPLNSQDAPGYLLTRSDQATDIISAVGADNLFLQFDIYHSQVMEGNLAHSLVQRLPIIRHIQFSGVPERHEPDERQEINYPYLFELLQREGYCEWIACEYRPRTTTLDGLGWAAEFGIDAAPLRRT